MSLGPTQHLLATNQCIYIHIYKYDFHQQIDQMQLGLPSRDYFLHLESEKDLEAYHSYMTDVATLLGANRTEAESQLWDIVKFEKVLANVSSSFKNKNIFFYPRLKTGKYYHEGSSMLCLAFPEVELLFIYIYICLTHKFKTRGKCTFCDKKGTMTM